MLHPMARLGLDSMMVIIGNLLMVAVNERTGGFAGPRHRFIGLFFDCFIITLIPLCTASDFEVDAFWIFILGLSMAEFGNCREFSMRWMLNGAAQTGPLRWLQCFSRHLHHHALAIGGVLLFYHLGEEAYRATAARILYFIFCTHSCQAVIRLRFKTLARRLSGLVGVLAFACICMLWFVDSNGPLEMRCLGIAAFIGTLLNVILNYFGPFVKSKSNVSTEIRGKNRRRSTGGADYEAHLTAKSSYSSKAFNLGELPEHLADEGFGRTKGESDEGPMSIDDSVDLDAEDEEAPAEPVVPTLLGLQPAGESPDDDTEDKKV